MPGPTGPFGDALVAAVRTGAVSEAAVDDKVLRHPAPRRAGGRARRRRARRRPAARRRRRARRPSARPGPTTEIAAELRAMRRRELRARPQPRVAAAAHGRLARAVAVVGPNAAVARTLGGGSATVFPRYTVSPLEGLRAALAPRSRMRAGCGPHTRLPIADVTAPTCASSTPTGP